jgi:hypothetical protein
MSVNEPHEGNSRMGTLSTTAKNTAVDAVAAMVSLAGLFGVTPVAGTTATASDDTFTKASHGMANDTPVLLTALTGGAGLVAGSANNADGGAKVYFVVQAATDTYKLSTSVGGSAFDFTSNVTAVTVNKLAELSGGTPAYARKALAFSAGVAGVAAITTAIAFDVPACTVGAVGYFTAGGVRHLIDGVIFDTYAQQGVSTLTAGSISSTDL